MKDRQCNDQKKDRQYNDQKKDRQYNDQTKKDRQYNDQKKKDRQYNDQKKKTNKQHDFYPVSSERFSIISILSKSLFDEQKQHTYLSILVSSQVIIFHGFCSLYVLITVYKNLEILQQSLAVYLSFHIT